MHHDFVQDFFDFHSFPVQITHEILEHNMAYTQHIPLADLDTKLIVIYRKSATNHTLRKFFADAFQCMIV